MRKICLSVIGLYLGLLQAFSQQSDSSAYRSRKLKLEEVNFVSSYYKQDGDNSAVEGGVGSEKLTDVANILDLKLTIYDKRNRKHTITGEAGIDYYTSASSDRIDTKANSSASSSDIRIYPSLSWMMEDEKRGYSAELHASGSAEFDYQSIGVGGAFSKKSADRNREVTVKAQVYLDQVKLITPVELRVGGGGSHHDDDDYGSSSRNSYSGSLSVSQVVNKRLQVMVMAELVKQEGYLGLPFHRVYFADNSLKAENLPSSRLKIPLGIRASYFLGDKVILRSFYRFYHDDWGLNAHTAELEVPVKVTPFLSIAPFYRYYNQSGVDYFAGYRQHQAQDEYYTSNYDLSRFDAHFLGAGIRWAPERGVLGVKHWNMIEFRYGHYNRSTGLQSDVLSLHLRFK